MKKKNVCETGSCKCHGGMNLFVGLVVLVWAIWFPTIDWRLILGGLLVLGGLAKSACKCECC